METRLAISDIGVYLDATKGFKMGKCPEGMSSFIAKSDEGVSE